MQAKAELKGLTYLIHLFVELASTYTFLDLTIIKFYIYEMVKIYIYVYT